MIIPCQLGTGPTLGGVCVPVCYRPAVCDAHMDFLVLKRKEGSRQTSMHEHGRVYIRNRRYECQTSHSRPTELDPAGRAVGGELKGCTRVSPNVSYKHLTRFPLRAKASFITGNLMNREILKTKSSQTLQDLFYLPVGGIRSRGISPRRLSSV